MTKQQVHQLIGIPQFTHNFKIWFCDNASNPVKTRTRFNRGNEEGWYIDDSLVTNLGIKQDMSPSEIKHRLGKNKLTYKGLNSAWHYENQWRAWSQHVKIEFDESGKVTHVSYWDD